jgi:hypothetical protein
MTKITNENPSRVRIHSTLNPQIDFTVTCTNLDAENLKQILDDLVDTWFNLESNPDLQFIPIGDYIAQSLQEKNLDFTIKYNQKPDCNLIGQDGNIFNLIGLTVKCLKENNLTEEAEELKDRIINKNEANSYYEALAIINEYVNVI